MAALPALVMASTANPMNMQQAPDHRKGALLCAEIQALIAVMRQNSKWAMVPGYGYGEEDLPEDPLLEEFKILRRKVFQWNDWWERDPLSYLGPFLEVIRSVETSGPITGMALSTVHRLLSQGFVDKAAPSASAAMHSIADAVAHCRFEETDHDSDEVVLAKILQALLACLRCPAGNLLSDDDVCSIVQACFRIGHHTGKEGELLQQLVRHTMHEMVRHIFGRLPEMPPLGADAVLLPRSPKPTAGDDAAAAASAGAGGEEVEAATAICLGPHYGLPCVLEVFQFLISLVSVEDAGSEDLCVFGLTLINSALEEGGAGFTSHPQVLSHVRDDLFRGLLAAGGSSNLSVLSFLCTVFLNLYLNMRSHLKLQIEAFLRGVVLVLGDGRKPQYDQQRVVMEAVVDLCRQPSFMADLYTNYDCALDRLNLFEDVCNLLSKNAFPVNCPLSAVHLLALEGLVTVVHTLAERAGGAGAGGALAAAPVAEAVGAPALPAYYDFWNEAMPTAAPAVEQAAWLRRRKAIKRQLTAAVEHFNRDVKKGLEFLQSLHLLPQEQDATAVALFFRHCPGLDKNVVGEYLGDPKPPKVAVLEAYAQSFEFAGLTIDASLRLFLEGFMLPGEAQKISRILENFASVYYACSKATDGVVADSDSVYVLSYSIIMLNTDLHNKQVKRKMTLEQFISNNRGTNGGKDWPRPLLTDIYSSISQDEIKLSSDGEVSSSRWADVLRRDTGHGSSRFVLNGAVAGYDADLFAIIWSPSIAAMSVVFEHTDDEAVLEEVLNGFESIAKVAAANGQTDVLDNLLSVLCKFTTLLSPAMSARPAVALGEDRKARMATALVFTIANKHGDHVRGGWRNLLDCILRLHNLALLPAAVTQPEGGIMTTQERAEPKVPARGLDKRTSSTSSLLRGLSSLLSMDSGEPSAPQPSEAEAAAESRTKECIAACRIDELFAESKLLEAESLLHLVRALIWAAGNPAALSDDQDTALFCLEQVLAMTLRNRDRLALLWPLVYEHSADIMQGASVPGALVERAVIGLIRVCQRLLPYKGEHAPQLLQSLQLLFKLHPRVAEAMLERIAREMLALLKGSMAYIKDAGGWKTVCKLLAAVACHQEASPVGLEALSLVMGEPAHVTLVNFAPCVDAAMAYVDSRVGGAERSTVAVDLLAGLQLNLGAWADHLRAHPPPCMEEATAHAETLASLWATLLEALTKLAVEARADVRDHALLALQRVLLAAEGMTLDAATLVAAFDARVLPVVAELSQAVSDRAADVPHAERSLRLAVTLLTKGFLQHLPRLHHVPAFLPLWQAILAALERAIKVAKGDELKEAVPEALKNILLVMASLGLLTPAAPGGLWDLTWKAAVAISPTLEAESLLNN